MASDPIAYIVVGLSLIVAGRYIRGAYPFTEVNADAE